MKEEHAEPSLSIQLTEGLPVEQLERQLTIAFRGGEVYQRMQAFYLFELDRTRAYQLLGHPSAVHFACARFDIERRTARELLTVGRALRELGRIDAGFREGRLSWSKTRLLCRICEPETQDAWIAHAGQRSVRELERDVRRAQRGELPRENRKGLPELRFDIALRVDGLTYELWEKAKAKLAAELGETPPEEELLRQLCTLVLATRADGSVPGRLAVDDALYQLVVDLRDGEAAIRSEAGPVELAAEDLATVARCGTITEREIPAIPSADPTSPKLRRKILARDGRHCVHCGSQRDLMVHHVQWRSRGGTTEARNLAALCAACHAMVHAGLLQISGEAPDGLRFLDRWGQDLKAPRQPPVVAWEIAWRTGVDKGTLETDRMDTIPAEIDVEWWRGHQHLFRWNRSGTGLELASQTRTGGGARAPQVPLPTVF